MPRIRRRSTASPILVAVLSSLVLAALIGAGCSRTDRKPAAPAVPPSTAPLAAPPPTIPAPPPPTLVATAQVPSVEVFDSPGAETASTSFANPNEWDLPLVFRVEAVLPDWVKVGLSTRPNGSTGWVRATDVAIAGNDWRLQVELGARRLTVWKGADVVRQETVAVGKPAAPTPTGDYYLTAIIPTGNDSGPYGPWAFGISAFSDVYTDFAGGPGQIGLHGTNQPGALGGDVSSGCIRVTNEAISALAEQVTPGAPIAIVA